jgi:hypothetical protein
LNFLARPAYLSKKLIRPLPTKDGGTRSIGRSMRLLTTSGASLSGGGGWAEVSGKGAEPVLRTTPSVIRSDISLAKTLERPDVQFAKTAQGLTDQQVLAAAKDPEWVKANTAWTRHEAGHFVRTGQTPAAPAVPYDEKRGFMEQLRDHEPVLGRPAHEAMTLKEATRASAAAEINFKKGREVAPQGFAIRENGSRFTFKPIPAASNAETVTMICANFAQQKVVCYVLTVAASSEGKQFVLFSAEDKSGMMVGQREIIMQPTAHLGPLEIIDSNVAEGRLVGLLPHPAPAS